MPLLNQYAAAQPTQRLCRVFSPRSLLPLLPGEPGTIVSARLRASAVESVRSSQPRTLPTAGDRKCVRAGRAATRHSIDRIVGDANRTGRRAAMTRCLTAEVVVADEDLRDAPGRWRWVKPRGGSLARTTWFSAGPAEEPSGAFCCSWSLSTSSLASLAGM